MKSIIIYILTFTIVFLGVTVGVFILNQKYNNIFALDFSPPQSMLRNTAASTLAAGDSLTVTTADSLAVAEQKSDSLQNEIRKLQGELQTAKAQIEQRDTRIEQFKKRLVTKHDSSYQAWLNSTKKLYETMSSSKAAKLLSQISDNQARDLLYSMNQKKAAAILQNLTIDKVKKLTRLR